MDNFEKTEYLNLNKLTNLNVYDVDPIMENFSLGENKIKEVETSLESLELKDTAIDVVAEEKKLNVVLSELRAEDIALEAKNVEQDIKIDEYKASVDDLNSTLTGYVARHKTANDGIHMIVGDNVE